MLSNDTTLSPEPRPQAVPLY